MIISANVKIFYKTYAVPRITGYLVVFTDISEWKSKGLYDESIICLTASNGNKKVSPELSYVCTNTSVDFNGSFLKQDKATFNHVVIVNIHTVYELSSILNDTVKLTKNADIDKYKYLEYGVGFNTRETFLLPNSSFSQDLIIFY